MRHTPTEQCWWMKFEFETLGLNTSLQSIQKKQSLEKSGMTNSTLQCWWNSNSKGKMGILIILYSGVDINIIKRIIYK